MSEESAILEFGDVSELAHKIRELIGVGDFEPVKVLLPQFDRIDNMAVLIKPKNAKWFDTLKTAPPSILRDLGMQPWDDDLWLYPAEWYDYIPEDYEIVDIRGSLENMEFFVPPILGGDPELVKEWEKDMSKVSEQIPQGMLINIHETGKYQDFISKATERLCEQAQWEIMDRTKKTLDKYIEGTKNTNPYVYSELLKYSKGPKCTFPGVKCKEPGPFGSKLALERLV